MNIYYWESPELTEVNENTMFWTALFILVCCGFVIIIFCYCCCQYSTSEQHVNQWELKLMLWFALLPFMVF